jgi:hypothetical protein
MIYGIERKVIKDKYTYIAETRLTQHFFFFTKHFLLEKEPVLRKQNSFGKAFLPKKRFVLKEKQK